MEYKHNASNAYYYTSCSIYEDLLMSNNRVQTDCPLSYVIFSWVVFMHCASINFSPLFFTHFDQLMCSYCGDFDCMPHCSLLPLATPASDQCLAIAYRDAKCFFVERWSEISIAAREQGMRTQNSIAWVKWGKEGEGVGLWVQVTIKKVVSITSITMRHSVSQISSLAQIWVGLLFQTQTR